MPAFVTRTLVNNLLNFISSGETEISFSTTTLKFFLKFLSQWLLPDDNHTAAVSVIGECLSRIVEKMVLLGTRNDDVGKISV